MDDHELRHVLDDLKRLIVQGDDDSAVLYLRGWCRGVVEQYLNSLVGTAELAQHWNHTERRARAYLAERHEKYGDGINLGGRWFLPHDMVDALKPRAYTKSLDETEDES